MSRQREVAGSHGSTLLYFTLVVGAGALVLVASVLGLVRHPPAASWYVLLVLTAISGSASVRLSDLPVSVSLSDTFTLAAALIFGADAGTVTVAVDALAMSRRLRDVPSGQAVRRLAFNVTAPALSLWAAAQVAFQLTGLAPLTDTPSGGSTVILPLLIFGTIFFAFNTGSVALIVALENRSRVWPVWRDAFAPLWPAYVGGACLAGLLAGFTASRAINPTALAVVLSLVLLLHLTYGTALTRLHRQVQHLQQIASYGEALRSTADAVVVTNDAGVVTFVNTAASVLTGWNPAHAEGLPLERVYQVRPTADPGLDERLLVTRDGEVRPIEQRSAPVVNDRGETVGSVITFRDITQRKALEAERAELVGRVEAANRVKDEFLRAISHELRTPATAVLGWARMLRDGRLQGDALRNALVSLERNATAQAALVETLLELAVNVYGAPSVQFEPVDVRESVKTAANLLHDSVSAKNLALRLDMPSDPVMASGDRDRLHQAIAHVLSNAVKFSHQAGTIDVRVAHGEGRVTITVDDCGEGIDPAVLPFIFDRFRQGNGSTTRPHRGLGIGLALVQHIVELHGGSVTAQSAGASTGASFTITLPAWSEGAESRIRLSSEQAGAPQPAA